MCTRNEILSEAVDKCMKELYSLAQPSVELDDFMQQNKEFHAKEKEYYQLPRETRPKYKEYMGPSPYEFYYIPREVMKSICDSYVYAYKIDAQQNLLDIIETLKNYCKEPIVDKYIDDWTDETGFHHPGYRSYDHPDNLVKEVTKILTKYDDSMDSEQGEEIVDKFFEFLDMAGNFYNWNRELNAFNMNVYLGASPNTSKEAVIKNWKEYRGVDIEIDDSKYEEDDDE